MRMQSAFRIVSDTQLTAEPLCVPPAPEQGEE